MTRSFSSRWQLGLSVAIGIVLATVAVLPARAGDEEKPPANGRNSKVQISGVGWMVYRYMLADEQLASAPAGALSDTKYARLGASSFDLDRVYLTCDYGFNDRINWQTTLEGSDLGGTLSLFVKRAYLKIKDPWGLKGQAFKFGIYGNVMVSQIDELWGYRSVSRAGIDRYLGVSSTYAGIGMEGKALGGGLDYDVMVANDTPYNKGVTYDAGGSDTSNRDKYKTLMGRLSISPLPGDKVWKGLRLSLFGQYGAKASGFVVDSTGHALKPLPASASDNHTLWYEVSPQYKSDKLTLSGEYAQKVDKTASQKQGKSATTAEVTSCYFGATATYALTTDLRAFLRGDVYDPDVDNDATAGTPSAVKIAGLKTTSVIAGLSRTMAKGLRSILDVEYTKFEDPKYKDGTTLSLDPDITLSARIEVTL